MKILVTGSSSGIGQAMVQVLTAAGHDVRGISRREKDPAWRVDLSQKTEIKKFTQNQKQWLATLDVLVNNAGLALGLEGFQDSQHEDIDSVLAVNLGGVFHLTREILPAMIARRRGDIVNLGSVAAWDSYPGGAIYSATKAAIHQWSEALRQDLAGTGVRVCTLAPGRVQTDFSKVRFHGDRAKAEKVYQGHRPLQSVDIAKTLEWILQSPPHVNIAEVVIWPTDQISVTRTVPVQSEIDQDKIR
jgi:3-hydroxy acid dehydrogenase/malonic semialdehyde reductase